MDCRADRAKQFMPFDALKGLQDASREKEIEYEQRKELLKLIGLEITYEDLKKYYK